MECPKCSNEMDKGLVVSKSLGGSFPGIGLYWCKERGFFNTKDRIDLLNLGGKKEAYICKECSMVIFEY